MNWCNTPTLCYWCGCHPCRKWRCFAKGAAMVPVVAVAYLFASFVLGGAVRGADDFLAIALSLLR